MYQRRVKNIRTGRTGIIVKELEQDQGESLVYWVVDDYDPSRVQGWYKKEISIKIR